MFHAVLLCCYVCSLCFASLTFSLVVPGLEKRKGETPNSFSLGKKEAGSLECSWVCVVLPHPIPPYLTTTHAAGCSRGRRTEKNLSRGVLRSKGEKWGINYMHQDNVRRGEPEKWIIHCWFLYMGRCLEEKSPTLEGRSWIFCISEWMASVSARMIQSHHWLLWMLLIRWTSHVRELGTGSSNTVAFLGEKKMKTL